MTHQRDGRSSARCRKPGRDVAQLADRSPRVSGNRRVHEPGDEQRAWRKTRVPFVRGAGPVPTIVGKGAVYLAVTLGTFFDPAPKQREAGRGL